MRLVSPNGYILFHGREVGFTRRFIIIIIIIVIIIIIIITTTPFEVEGCKVRYPTVYEGYMVWYIVGVCVSDNHFNIYG